MQLNASISGFFYTSCMHYFLFGLLFDCQNKYCSTTKAQKAMYYKTPLLTAANKSTAMSPMQVHLILFFNDNDVFMNKRRHHFIHTSYSSSFHRLQKDSESLTNLVLKFSHSNLAVNFSVQLVQNFHARVSSEVLSYSPHISLLKNKSEVFYLHFMARNYLLTSKRFQSPACLAE